MGPRNLIIAWLEAFYSRDVDLLVSYYSDDYQVAGNEADGKDAIREIFNKAFKSPDMFCEAVNIVEEGDRGVLEWKDPNGQCGCSVFHVRNGKITNQRNI